MVTINVESKATYDAGIAALRTYLANHRTGTVDITVSAYEGGDTLDFKMRCQKLYLDGFQKTGSGKWFHFNDATGWAGSTALPYGGAHRDLGTDKADTKLNPAAKFKIDQIINFEGGKGSMADTLRLGLCFYVVAISEAARFTPIQAAMSDLIGSVKTSYAPKDHHTTYMSNWETLTTANKP